MTEQVQAAGQRGEAGARRGQPLVVVGTVHTEGLQRCLRQLRVADVVRPEQAQPRHPRAGFALDPGHGPEQRGVGPQQGAAAVGDDGAHPRTRAQRELVAVVAVRPAVPVQVVLRQRRHHDDRRPCRHVCGLVGGGLHDPPVDVLLDLGVPRRHAEVAAGEHPVAQPTQQPAHDRGGRALALGAGHGEHAVAVGVLEPQPEPAADGDARGLDLQHVRAVAAQPGSLDHHVTSQQQLQTALRRRHDPRTGTVVHDDGLHAEHRQPPQVGLPLDAQAPHADPQAGELRPRRQHARAGSRAGPSDAGTTRGPARPGSRRPARAAASCRPGPGAAPRAARRPGTR